MLTEAPPGEYKCTNCGSEDYAVVRQDASNPRLRCSKCNFVFAGADSLAAEEAGKIPSSSAESLAAAEEPERETAMGYDEHGNEVAIQGMSGPGVLKTVFTREVPQRPAFVFISKNGHSEFCTKKDVKSVALRWHDTPHKAYELVPKKFQVNVGIS